MNIYQALFLFIPAAIWMAWDRGFMTDDRLDRIGLYGCLALLVVLAATALGLTAVLLWNLWVTLGRIST